MKFARPSSSTLQQSFGWHCPTPRTAKGISKFRATMETATPTNEELDDEFDQSLVSMKPHVLHVSHKSERQRCANWIKKLCEPPGTGPTARKNRNMYAKLLLHMLQKGVVEGPFTHRPEPGPLSTLPAYMSMYFDEPGQGQIPAHGESGARSLPDWVHGELSENNSSSSAQPNAVSTLRERYQHTAGSSRAHHRRTRTENSILLAKATGDKEYHSHVAKAKEEVRSRHRRSFTFSSDEDDENRPRRHHRARSPARNAMSDTNLEIPSYDWRLPSRGTSGPTSPHKTSFPASVTMREESMMTRQHEKELEMRTKVIEAKYHEEKLQLQQRHDQAIQKILDRKNSEMEDIKSHYRSKSKEMEDTVRKLERKVQSLTKESTMMRESRDQQIAELRKMVEHTDQSTQNEYETKLHERSAEFEQEKFDMQKQHTKAIQEILDDTNTRLHKMETEYSSQVESHAAVIRELEARIMQLSQESERQNAIQGQLGQEKGELERRHILLTAELENTRTRYTSLEKEAERATGDHEMEMRSMRNKTDASIEFMKQEHTLSTAKSAETIRELEQHLQDMKQLLQDSEHQRQRELRDLESILKQDKLHQGNLHEQQMSSLKSELEQEKQDGLRRITKLQQAIRDKEEHLEKVVDQKKLQSVQAEKALEDFKLQVEHNSSRMFDDMKAQMQKVEADLLQSKELRQTQTKEYERHLELERKRFDKQLSERELAHTQKYAQLLQQHQAERESMQQEHEHILAVTTDRLQSRVDEDHNLNQQRQDRDTTMITELEQKVRELREANMQSNSLRKQQLVELGLLRDEEKQKAQRECEAAVSQLKSEMEQQRLRLQRDHSAEMELTLQQTNARLKELEKDYTEQLAKSAENVKQLKNTIETLKQESNSRRSQLERQMADSITKLEDEKELVKKQHTAYHKTLHQDLDKQRSRARQVERQLQQRDFQHQDQMTHLKQEYESRMRGLMPLNVRQELEDTIESLKSQVTALQQKSVILQEEIDVGRKYPSTVRSPSRN